MDFSNVLTWLGNNWVAVGLGVFMVVEKLVKLSPAAWDDIIVDGIKALAKSKGKAAVFLALAGCVLLLYGCAAMNTAYVPPTACECVAGEDGACEYDSLILDTVPDPSGASLVLKLTNLAAIQADLYTAGQALAVVNDIRDAVEVADSWTEFVAYVGYRLDRAPVAVTAILLTSEYLSAFDVPSPLSACDQALLFKHLDDQEALLLALPAED